MFGGSVSKTVQCVEVVTVINSFMYHGIMGHDNSDSGNTLDRSAGFRVLWTPLFKVFLDAVI